MGSVRLVMTACVALALIAASSDARASVTYTYDSQGRIITAQYSNGTSIAYTYDDAGNVTSHQVTCSSNGC